MLFQYLLKASALEKYGMGIQAFKKLFIQLKSQLTGYYPLPYWKQFVGEHALTLIKKDLTIIIPTYLGRYLAVRSRKHFLILNFGYR